MLKPFLNVTVNDENVEELVDIIKRNDSSLRALNIIIFNPWMVIQIVEALTENTYITKLNIRLNTMYPMDAALELRLFNANNHVKELIARNRKLNPHSLEDQAARVISQQITAGQLINTAGTTEFSLTANPAIIFALPHVLKEKIDNKLEEDQINWPTVEPRTVLGRCMI